MSPHAGKRCVVAYAAGPRQLLLPVELPADATIGDAIEAARRQAAHEGIPWESAPAGIFGEIRSRGDVPADGDRIELYRPLREDPKEKRRARLRR